LGRELFRGSEVDEHEVGIGAWLEATLAVEAEPAGDVSRGDPGDQVEVEAPGAMALAQQQSEQRLATGDPSPRGEGVVCALQRRGRWRMVRRDHRQPPVVERVPQRLALVTRAQRRRTFRDVAESVGVLLGEYEVVRARLAADVDSACACLGDDCYSAPRRDMND